MKKLLIFVTVFGFSLLFLYYNRLKTIDKLEEYHNNVRKTKYTILLWTKYFRENDWEKQNLKQLKCEYSNCFLTNDRKVLNTSDALLFHWWDFSPEDMPHYHQPNQKWVLFNWESVRSSPLKRIQPIADRIDWLMSYKKDSDIYVPYGSVFKCDNRWTKRDQFDNKTKSIAWIVSNCDTWDKREELVHNLKKYIDIDVFGRCGRKARCNRKGSSCYEMIARNYKFYLSFENTLCKDYITEKLFRTLDYDTIIPIVYGGADYKSILPNNSYINVMDFNSTQSLAQYLKDVAKDKERYNSYFEWRNGYCSRQTHYRYLCELCRKLNDQTVDSHQHNHRSILDQWNVRDDCHEPANVSAFRFDKVL